MGLPRAIEYLLTLEHPGGAGQLVHTGVTQSIVPVFPPNTSIILSTSPKADDYALLPYYSGFGPAMVPDAFTVYIEQYGAAAYSATITSWMYSGLFPIESYIPVTQNHPSIVGITNVTTLNQYYESFSFFLRIATEQDWDVIQEALTTLVKLEELAKEANGLLRIMAGRPQPPFGR